MCDSDDKDMCHSGCTDFSCKNNFSYKKETPSYNLEDLYDARLYGYNRCCVGVFKDNKLEILPYVLTYDNARILVISLKEFSGKRAIILKQLTE